LIRHAETAWNRENRIQGHLDSSLTKSGREQAYRWGLSLKRFPWDRILSSDLGRAATTANLVNLTLDLPIQTDPGLREQSWGLWEGKIIDEIPASENLTGCGWSFRPPGGEGRETVRERAAGVLSRKAAEWPGQNILVVTHEGVLKCLAYRLLGRSFLPSEPPLLKAGHLHRLKYEIANETGHEKGCLRIEKINAVDLNEIEEA
jgi:probable phosphoglycerate mutase